MSDPFDQRISELWAETENKGWQQESRIAHVQNGIAKEYARIHARTKAANDQAWEAKHGRPQRL